MKLKILLGIFLFLIILFQSSFTTLPFLVATFTLLAVFFRKNWVVFVAFLCGILFDIMSFKTIGTTSIFLVAMIFLIYVYQNKFEIGNYHFVFASVFISSFLFLFFMNFNNIFFQSIFMALISAIVFYLLHPFRSDKIVN